jgi:mutator protein MutT
MPNGIKQSAWAKIVNKDGLVLLLLRSKKVNNPKLWNFPGGNIDLGENAEISTIRELREEAGIKLNSMNFLKLIAKPNVSMFYYGAIVNNNTKVTINEESAEYKWFSIEEAKKLNLHPPTLAYLSGKI